MAKIYYFPTKIVARPGLNDLFTGEEIRQYQKYLKDSDNWQREVKPKTLYDGYPSLMPCHPIREDMIWYFNKQLNFGTWLINKSKESIEANADLVWGWSPFVRKSTAPVYEPLHLTQMEMRKNVTWIVDEDGYGQYGLVTNKGELWVPHPRPANWEDHNTAIGT